MPNLVSLASRVLEMWRGSQNSKSRSRDPGHPLLSQFYIPCIEPLSVLLRAKLGISSFVRSGDMEGSQNFKSRSRDVGHAPFDPILYFFAYGTLGSFSLPNLTSVALSLMEIWRESQNLKN